jgi:hypothetical protein
VAGTGSNRDDIDGEPEVVIEGPETHHHHHSTGIKWFDAITTLSVLMVSIASVVISVHTGQAMEDLVRENARMVRANSTPLLNFSTGNADDDGKPLITMTVSNSGTGPARVVWIQISNEGKAQSTILDLARSTGAPIDRVYSVSRPLAHTLLKAGEERTFISWNKPKSDTDPQAAAWKATDKARFGFKVEACYCSLLGECWHSTLDGDIPQPVPVCTPQGHPSFGELPKG